MSDKKRLFWDIETSYMKVRGVWRAGKQYVNPANIIEYPKIICISYKWEGEEEVHTLTWDKKQCDKKLIKKFIKVLNNATESVAHNGDRFDMKWLRGRALYHRIPMRPRYETIDTLKFCKSQFNLPSNKLGEVAKYLGVSDKMDTGGFSLWQNIVENKCEESMEKMIQYCEQDVKTLEEVYNVLRPYSKHRHSYGEEKWHCPECGTSNVGYSKEYKTAMGTRRYYLKCRDKECSTHYPVSGKAYSDMLKFKMKHNIK
jgi:hypothetical protein